MQNVFQKGKRLHNASKNMQSKIFLQNFWHFSTFFLHIYEYRQAKKGKIARPTCAILTKSPIIR